MKKNLIVFSIIITIIGGLFINKNKSKKINGFLPVPTELNLKKSKRKDFKNQRKEYIRNMHRSHPDYDWEKMNEENRKIRTNKVREIRQSLLINEKKENDSQLEIISRNLNGHWHERGSNNLAGRILTAEIDWQHNQIYCASDGGNIWRGSLSGENWTSLTDYFQIKGIHFLRITEFNNTRRILIANNNNFYFSDDEGNTLQNSNGLDFLNNWSGNYLKRVIMTKDENIYLLATEGTGNWNANL